MSRFKLLKLEGELVHRDVTRGHYGPSRRMHVANSIGHAIAVLPTSRMTSSEGISEPYHPLGWDGAPRLADDARVRCQ